MDLVEKPYLNEVIRVSVTSGDLEARWRPLTSEEKTRARQLIDDAGYMIRDECPRAAQADEHTIRRIVCAMVKRAMSAPFGNEGLVGASQASMTAGPFTQSVTVSNPSGDLYLTKREKVLLNGGRGRAHEVDLIAGTMAEREGRNV